MAHADRAIRDLLAAAQEAMANAYAPYSNYHVGAAVLTGGGRVCVGCNVENASYGLAICAERLAICKAVSEGEREIVALAVVTDGEAPAAPCGACRQVMAEFSPSGDMIVVWRGAKGKPQVQTLRDLLPWAFKLR